MQIRPSQQRPAQLVPKQHPPLLIQSDCTWFSLADDKNGDDIFATCFIEGVAKRSGFSQSASQFGGQSGVFKL